MSPAAIKPCAHEPCGIPIGRHQFMCLKHWRMLGKGTQAAINSLFKEQRWVDLMQAHQEAKAELAVKLGARSQG